MFLINRRNVALGFAFSLGAYSQGQAQATVDSLQLRFTRIQAEPTNACQVIVRTSGTMNIQATLRPTDILQWIDSATAIAAASPARAKGQRVQLAWIPMTLGFKRTITDRFDAVALTNSGHEIPILRSELVPIVRLLDSAAARAVKLSSASGDCPSGSNHRRAPPDEELKPTAVPSSLVESFPLSAAASLRRVSRARNSMAL